MAIVNGPYPATSPCSARSTKSCQGCVASPISVITNTQKNSERCTSSLLPKRSPTRPHRGAQAAATAGVTPSVKPVQSATARVSCTPSAWKRSARNGITRVKPVKPTNEAIISAA